MSRLETLVVVLSVGAWLAACPPAQPGEECSSGGSQYRACVPGSECTWAYDSAVPPPRQCAATCDSAHPCDGGCTCSSATGGICWHERLPSQERASVACPLAQ